MAAKFEDLIFQAPDNNDVVDEPQYSMDRGTKAVSRICKFCRFVFPGRRSDEVPKLSAVVPYEPSVSALQDRLRTISIPLTQPTAAELSSATQPKPGQGIDPVLTLARKPHSDEAPSQPPAQELPLPEHGAPRLGPQAAANTGRKTLVLDLDETLVHSSLRQLQDADMTIAVEVELGYARDLPEPDSRERFPGRRPLDNGPRHNPEVEQGYLHDVYVRKRPGVDEFLVEVGKIYEVVLYTASLANYANPLLDELDTSGDVISWRLFREACTRSTCGGGYVKDLSKLGRDLRNVIIIDNSPTCYSLQPHNAIPIKTWKEDKSDRDLLDLIPILRSLADVDDIPVVLKHTVWAATTER